MQKSHQNMITCIIMMQTYALKSFENSELYMQNAYHQWGLNDLSGKQVHHIINVDSIPTNLGDAHEKERALTKFEWKRTTIYCYGGNYLLHVSLQLTRHRSAHQTILLSSTP